MRTIRTALALALAATLARAQVTTIQVEIDFMADAFHSHRPTQAEIDAVVQMFACKGIALIVDVDDDIGHVDVVRCADPGNEDFFTCTTSTTSFASLRAAFRDQGAGWHYCIFGHFYDDGEGTTSSGIAEILGNDLFVADGTLIGVPETPYWRAATFAHELGHNLGLRHYSPENVDEDPFSPNLASIMSYQYQLNGLETRLECLGLVGNDHRFKELDFSSGRLPPLDEAALFEPRGVDVRGVDWNCDGNVAGTVSRDLAGDGDWCAQGADVEVLYDYDEWSALMDVADAPTVAEDRVPLEYETCAGPSVLAELPGTCASVSPPALLTEPCVQGEMVFVDPANVSGSENGTGRYPYRYVSALLAVPDGSVAYLQPGVHRTASGGGLVLDFPLVLAGPGGAVVDP